MSDQIIVVLIVAALFFVMQLVWYCLYRSVRDECKQIQTSLDVCSQAKTMAYREKDETEQRFKALEKAFKLAIDKYGEVDEGVKAFKLDTDVTVFGVWIKTSKTYSNEVRKHDPK